MYAVYDTAMIRKCMLTNMTDWETVRARPIEALEPALTVPGVRAVRA
jgi:hypothetical protein